jgi:UDP-glucose 4-epimerase
MDVKLASSSRVLVTGVAGFMGSHVADECLDLGYSVIGVDDLSGGFIENVPAGVTFRQASVANVADMERIWDEHGGFDIVYHLAAYAAEGLSHFIRRYNYMNNLIGSINLINLSVLHQTARFVFTSSIAVYGSGQTPMKESMVPVPEDPYGVAKYAVELDLAAAQHMFGLNYTIFRPHNVYGERQNIADPYRNVIGIFINQALQGRPMTIFGDGTQTRAFTYISDVAPTIASAPTVAGTKNQVFNIGADTPYSVLELAEVVADSLGVPRRVQHLEARKEVVDAFSDHGKVKDVFGAVPRIPLSEGIRRMAMWASDHGSREPRRFEGIEVMKNLPTSWKRLIG